MTVEETFTPITIKDLGSDRDQEPRKTPSVKSSRSGGSSRRAPNGDIKKCKKLTDRQDLNESKRSKNGNQIEVNTPLRSSTQVKPTRLDLLAGSRAGASMPMKSENAFDALMRRGNKQSTEPEKGKPDGAEEERIKKEWMRQCEERRRAREKEVERACVRMLERRKEKEKKMNEKTPKLSNNATQDKNANGDEAVRREKSKDPNPNGGSSGKPKSSGGDGEKMDTGEPIIVSDGEGTSSGSDDLDVIVPNHIDIGRLVDLVNMRRRENSFEPIYDPNESGMIRQKPNKTS